MKECENCVWGILGYSYDGCNGWSEWVCEDLIFTSSESALEYIKDRWGNFQYARYKPYKISLKD